MTFALVVPLLLLAAWLLASPRVRPWLTRRLRGPLSALAVFYWPAWPLGAEDRLVRRHPWVTYSIIGMCFAVFQVQLLTEPGPEWRPELHQAWTEAVTYAVEHPYLKLPPMLDQYAGKEIDRRVKELAEVPRRPFARSVLEAEQEELSRRAEALWAVYQQQLPRRWGFVPARSSWVNDFTSIFLHGGWLHLVGNMLFLLLCGPYVEDVYGRFLFTLMFFGSGIVGDAATRTVEPDSFATGYGASGAIAGVMGAFLVRFTTRRLRFLVIPAVWLPVAPLRVTVPAYAFLLPWLAQNVVAAKLGVPGVGWWAHLGGFAFGFLFALVMRLTRIEAGLVDPRIEASLSLQQHPAVERASAYRTAGRPEMAQVALLDALDEAPQDLGVLLEAYDAAVAAEDLARAQAHAIRVIGVLETRPDADSMREAFRFIKEVRVTLDEAWSPRFHIAAADYLARHGEKAQALVLYETVANRPGEPLARVAVARQARVREQLG